MSQLKTNNLTTAKIGQEYLIESIYTQDEELEGFLFSLGCYAGEKITVISTISDNYVVAIKDARYSIDRNLARAILLK